MRLVNREAICVRGSPPTWRNPLWNKGSCPSRIPYNTSAHIRDSLFQRGIRIENSCFLFGYVQDRVEREIPTKFTRKHFLIWSRNEIDGNPYRSLPRFFVSTRWKADRRMVSHGRERKRVITARSVVTRAWNIQWRLFRETGTWEEKSTFGRFARSISSIKSAARIYRADPPGRLINVSNPGGGITRSLIQKPGLIVEKRWLIDEQVMWARFSGTSFSARIFFYRANERMSRAIVPFVRTLRDGRRWVGSEKIVSRVTAGEVLWTGTSVIEQFVLALIMRFVYNRYYVMHALDSVT